MKVKIGGVIYDAEKEPVLLIFKDDQERRVVGSHILAMESKEGIRGYAQFPKGLDPETVEQFMKL